MLRFRMPFSAILCMSVMECMMNVPNMWDDESYEDMRAYYRDLMESFNQGRSTAIADYVI
jgi:hypothetical protein